jgi:hypothetical protein
LWPNQSNAIAPLLNTTSRCLTFGLPWHRKELFGSKADFGGMIFAKFIFDMFYDPKQTLLYATVVKGVYNYFNVLMCSIGII